jgi:hypothetical protein
MMMPDWSSRLTQCWDAAEEPGDRSRHAGQEGSWDGRSQGGEGQTQDAEDGNHFGGGGVFGLMRVSELDGVS